MKTKKNVLDHVISRMAHFFSANVVKTARCMSLSVKKKKPDDGDFLDVDNSRRSRRDSLEFLSLNKS